MPESAEERVRKLARAPGNTECPNCGQTKSFGFSSICAKFHTFVCNECKTSHQAISHRCKSITMSAWTMQEVKELEQKGNDYCRRTWLARAPPIGQGGRPDKGSPVEVFKRFILEAYEQKRYYEDERYASGSGPVTVTATAPAARVPAVAATPPVVADLLDFGAFEAAQPPPLVNADFANFAPTSSSFGFANDDDDAFFAGASTTTVTSNNESSLFANSNGSKKPIMGGNSQSAALISGIFPMPGGNPPTMMGMSPQNNVSNSSSFPLMSNTVGMGGVPSNIYNNFNNNNNNAIMNGGMLPSTGGGMPSGAYGNANMMMNGGGGTGGYHYNTNTPTSSMINSNNAGGMTMTPMMMMMNNNPNHGTMMMNNGGGMMMSSNSNGMAMSTSNGMMTNNSAVSMMQQHYGAMSMPPLSGSAPPPKSRQQPQQKQKDAFSDLLPF
jgi:hypothetical protein